MKSPETLDFRASPKTTFAKNKYLHISRHPQLSSKGKKPYSHILLASLCSVGHIILSLVVGSLSKTPIFQGLLHLKRPHAEEFSSTQGLFLLISIFSSQAANSCPLGIIGCACGQQYYSNSIVAGGFPVQSYSTLLTPLTSFTILLVTLPITSQGSSAASAVIKSEVVTARNATA